MPTVTKHSYNNLVTVSYPVREAILDITHAEHALILMFSHEKVKMIKFIRSQYNLGLYDAKQVVDTVIASAEAKPEIESKVMSVATEVDWSLVKEGTMICVQDYPEEKWYIREFLRYDPDSSYNFTCKSFDDDEEIVWKYAKLLSSM